VRFDALQVLHMPQILLSKIKYNITRLEEIITILLKVGTLARGNFYALSSLVYHLVGYAKSSRVLTT